MPRLTDRPSLPPVTPGPKPRPVLPPASPALTQRSWAALTLAALGLLAMTLIGGSNIRRTAVVVVVALVIAALGLGLAIWAMSAARREGTARPRGSVLATVLAAMGLGFGAFALIGFAMFWPQLTRFSDCMRGAATVSAQDACQQQFDNSVGVEIHLLGGR
jgi:ABC-type amino acid transport system permease subunit